MSRLENKLIELCYKEDEFYGQITYSKIAHGCTIHIDVDNGRITTYHIHRMYAIENQQHIDNIQKAYDILQQDLEELKKCLN